MKWWETVWRRKHCYSRRSPKQLHIRCGREIYGMRTNYVQRNAALCNVLHIRYRWMKWAQLNPVGTMNADEWAAARWFLLITPSSLRSPLGWASGFIAIGNCAHRSCRVAPNSHGPVKLMRPIEVSIDCIIASDIAFDRLPRQSLICPFDGTI